MPPSLPRLYPPTTQCRMIVVPLVAMFCGAGLTLWIAAAMDVLYSTKQFIGVVMILTSLNWGFFLLASHTWAFPVPMGAIIVAPVCAGPAVVFFVATTHSLRTCSKKQARQVFFQVRTNGRF